MEKIKAFWHDHKESNWFIVLLLLLFFPVGLYLMWRYSGWNKGPKWIITVIFAVLLLINTGGDDSGDQIIDEPAEVHAEAESETKDTEEEAEKEAEEKLKKEEAEKEAEKEREQEEAEKAAEEEAEKEDEEKRKEEEVEKEAEEEREQEEVEKEAEEEAEKEAEKKRKEEAEKEAEEEHEQEEAEEAAEKEVEEKRKEEEAEKEAEEDLSPEEVIEVAVREEPKAVITDVIVTSDGTEAIVSVTFEGRENLTLGLTKTGIHDSMTRILFSLKDLEYEFIDITLMAELPLVDQYGNEESSVVMRGHYDSSVLNEINPENRYIVQDNIQNIALDW